MSVIRYREYHPLPPLQPHEIRYLRETLDWSQAKMADFLGRTKATVSRWELGYYTPDEVTLGVLHKLWMELFGEYEGPYANMYESAPAERAPDLIARQDVVSTIGKALLIGGVAFFLAKGLRIDKED